MDITKTFYQDRLKPNINDNILDIIITKIQTHINNDTPIHHTLLNQYIETSLNSNLKIEDQINTHILIHLYKTPTRTSNHLKFIQSLFKGSSLYDNFKIKTGVLDTYCPKVFEALQYCHFNKKDYL